MNYSRGFGTQPLFPEAIVHLIIINVLVFAAMQLQQAEALYDQLITYSIFSPEFRPWQVITHMFMHADVGHLFGNMLMLFFFGRMLTANWDTRRFIFFYLSCGLAAFFVHQVYLVVRHGAAPGVISPGFLGASGAVYGVIVASATMFPNQIMFPFPIPVKLYVGFIILGDIWAGFLGPPDGIAHFAHLGGALAGFLIVRNWQRNRFKRN